MRGAVSLDRLVAIARDNYFEFLEIARIADAIWAREEIAMTNAAIFPYIKEESDRRDIMRSLQRRASGVSESAQRAIMAQFGEDLEKSRRNG